MAETVSQLWTRLTGQDWGASRQYGSGSYGANMALRGRLLGGWRPGGQQGGQPGQPAAPVDNRTELQRFTEDTSRQRNEALAGQNAQQQNYFNLYKQTIGGQEKMGDAYGRLSGEAGIPQLREQLGVFKGQIFNIKGLLDRLNEDINSRTSGSFTTESQARRMEASEGADLNNQLGRLGTGMGPLQEALSGATQEVSNRLGFMQSDQARELKPLELEIGSLSDRFAREITGFNSNKEGELDALMSKIERQQQLDDREWARASQLASESRAYNAQMAAAKAALEASRSGGSGQGGQTSMAGMSLQDRIRTWKSAGMSPDEIQRAEAQFSGYGYVGGSTSTPQNTGGGGTWGSGASTSNFQAPGWLQSFNRRFGR